MRLEGRVIPACPHPGWRAGGLQVNIYFNPSFILPCGSVNKWVPTQTQAKVKCGNPDVPAQGGSGGVSCVLAGLRPFTLPAYKRHDGKGEGISTHTANRLLM